jgi:hypothetical protein
MELKVQNLASEDTWKDIVRINKGFRKDRVELHIPRGKICRITVGKNSKWVIVHGREPKDNVIQMDLTTRLALEVETEQPYEFSLDQLPWIKTLWFPWKASDPMYRLPAQLSIVSFFLGVVLGVLGIIVGLMPTNTCRLLEKPLTVSSNFPFRAWNSGDLWKEGGEDAERGKKRADVVHEVDAGVVGKLAQQCGADTA